MKADEVFRNFTGKAYPESVKVVPAYFLDGQWVKMLPINADGEGFFVFQTPVWTTQVRAYVGNDYCELQFGAGLNTGGRLNLSRIIVTALILTIGLFVVAYINLRKALAKKAI
jgi:hypothetical protein